METIENDEPKKTRNIWIRGLIMLAFVILLGIGQWLLGLVAIVQFLWLLIGGEKNQFLSRFGTSLAKWYSETVQFLSCASEDKPFPWKEWPVADH